MCKRFRSTICYFDCCFQVYSGLKLRLKALSNFNASVKKKKQFKQMSRWRLNVAVDSNFKIFIINSIPNHSAAFVIAVDSYISSFTYIITNVSEQRFRIRILNAVRTAQNILRIPTYFWLYEYITLNN